MSDNPAPDHAAERSSHRRGFGNPMQPPELGFDPEFLSSLATYLEPPGRSFIPFGGLPGAGAGTAPSTRMAPPEEAPPEVLKAWSESAIKFNKAAERIITNLGEQDGKAGRQRWAVLIVMSVLTLVGAGGFIFALIALVSNPNGPAAIAAISGAAVLIGTVITAGVLNPLRTIERDVVFRRWSDVIMAGFMMQLGSWDNSANVEYRRALTQASKQFGVLAVAFGGESSKVNESLLALLTLNEGAQEPAKTAITVTAPGDRTAQAGTKIEPFTVEATGPETLTWTVAGQPGGIVIAASSGEFSGTPTTSGEFTTVVTVKSSGSSSSASVTFTWLVSAAAP